MNNSRHLDLVFNQLQWRLSLRDAGDHDGGNLPPQRRSVLCQRSLVNSCLLSPAEVIHACGVWRPPASASNPVHPDWSSCRVDLIPLCNYCVCIQRGEKLSEVDVLTVCTAGSVSCFFFLASNLIFPHSAWAKKRSNWAAFSVVMVIVKIKHLKNTFLAIFVSSF